jgi:hypothetical protein
VKNSSEMDENFLFSEIKNWIQRLEKTSYLYVQEFLGHMRRILMACPFLFLNSTIELFSYALFQYQFINTTSRINSRASSRHRINRTLSAQEIEEQENIEDADFKELVMENMRKVSEQKLEGMPNISLKELVEGDTEDFFDHLDLKEKKNQGLIKFRVV